MGAVRLAGALYKGNKLTAHWVPGHQGTIGNETADGFAKEAAMDKSFDQQSKMDPSSVKRQSKQRPSEWNGFRGEMETENPSTLASSKPSVQKELRNSPKVLASRLSPIERMQ